MLSLDLIRISRQKHLELIQNLSTEILNKTPEGFNNNLIWNFAHVVITPEILCFKLAGLPLFLNEELINIYKKGTIPPKFVSESEINIIKDEAIKASKNLEKVFKGKPSVNYLEPYLTSYGITLTNTDEALTYCAMHEAAHLNFSKALLKTISKS